MGALTSYADYKSRIEAGLVVPVLGGASGAGSNELWTQYGSFGSPTTAVACYGSSNLSGQLCQSPVWPGSTVNGEAWLLKAEYRGLLNVSTATPLLCDRLSHMGGLVGNVATAQTTNLPTAALPRYTTGAGVMIGVVIHTAIGSTATTFTISYTNQAGTSGRTTRPAQIGGASRNTAWQFFIPALQDGDTGVRSVESFTLAATTGTAGAIGIVLFKPLFATPAWGYDTATNSYAEGIQGGKLIEVEPNACLMCISKLQASGTMVGFINVAEIG